jgi:hypothetical protein
VKRPFTVMGFTEAELGFVLAAAFAAIAVTYQATGSAQQKEVDSLRTGYGSLKRQLDSVKSVAESVTPRKRSNLVPPCAEKGEPGTPIADLTVADEDLYRSGTDSVTSDEVFLRLGIFLTRSDSLQCKYTVRLRPGGLDDVRSSRARLRLTKRFYVDYQP